MGTRRVKIDDLGKAISDILDQYGEDIQNATQEAVLKVAKIAQQETKAGSPVRKVDTKKRKKGRYRRGWAVKKDVVNRFRTDAIIHNRTDYQLTHLLEKGHILKRGGRTLGRISPQVHIEPAEQHAIKNLEEAIEKIAKG